MVLGVLLLTLRRPRCALWRAHIRPHHPQSPTSQQVTSCRGCVHRRGKRFKKLSEMLNSNKAKVGRLASHPFSFFAYRIICRELHIASKQPKERS